MISRPADRPPRLEEILGALGKSKPVWLSRVAPLQPPLGANRAGFSI